MKDNYKFFNDCYKIFNYSGNKSRFLDKINFVINSTNKKIYFEPFVGSGVVFLNLTKEFDKYIINDIDRNVIRIFESFKNITYDDYLSEINYIEKRFGDISNNNIYYNFRDWFNDNEYGTDTIQEGIYLSMLYNSCMNGFARFGDNGFNQGCGKRNYSKAYTKEIHNVIQGKLKKCVIINQNFLDISDINDCCIFLDPPYFTRPSSYTAFSNSEYCKFINFIKSAKEHNNDIVYTDIFSDIVNLPYVILRDQIPNTSPNKRSEINNMKEVCYYNFQLIKKY